MRTICAMILLSAVARADTSTGRAGAKPNLAGVTLEYHVPEGSNPPDADYRFTEHKAGDRVWLVATGAPVTIVEVLGRERDGDRVNLRYVVRRPDGSQERVFGGDLTPLRLEADVDRDGQPEIVTLSFTPAFQLRLMVIKGGTSTELELTPAGQGFLSQKGGWGSLGYVDAKTAGIPLLRVDSRPEACADFSVTYVSDTAGKLQPALSLGGLADPPNHSVPSAKFDPKTKTVVVTQTNSEEDEKGKTHSRKSVTRYQLEPDGVFREIAAPTASKGKPPGRRPGKR